MTVFTAFLRLGLTSFGGPIAHLGYFREEFVVRRRWLTDETFAELVALCQFLPGPASSQVGIAIGFSRAGFAGALAAWTAFTLPSAVALTLFATALSHSGGLISAGVLHGLKLVAVSVVAQAVWGMSRLLITDIARFSLMICSATLVLFNQSASTQLAIIAGAAMLGLWIVQPSASTLSDPIQISIRKRTGAALLLVFAALRVSLPVLAKVTDSQNPRPVVLWRA